MAQYEVGPATRQEPAAPLGLGPCQPRGLSAPGCFLTHLPFSRCGLLGRGLCLKQTRARLGGYGARGGRQMCLWDLEQAHGCVFDNKKIFFSALMFLPEECRATE